VINSYLVAGNKPWARSVFEQQLAELPGKWRFISRREELNQDFVRQFSPRYIFFLHWSWKVPSEILQSSECVCFHMTDVPYGRGGSPLQNLILRGHSGTKLTALRMTNEMDAGPVYFKELLSLEGNAEEIYLRAASMAAVMAKRIVLQEPEPSPQRGEIVNFLRRKPAESRITAPESLQKLHDFIRMLDADGYPQAFLEYGGFRFEFTRSALYDGRIVADVKITKQPKEAQDIENTNSCGSSR
jgi:methionyl-tRNA formyltransferase